MTQFDAYNSKEGVASYFDAIKDKPRFNFLPILKKFLNPEAHILELGMGSGIDFDTLKPHFKITGSDNSSFFLEVYIEKNGTTNLLNLDAKNLNLNEQFDCIFSNKVLHHLTQKELEISMEMQSNILNKEGIVAHTFWIGEKKIETQNLSFNQYSFKELKSILSKNYNIIFHQLYQEDNFDDSILLIASKK